MTRGTDDLRPTEREREDLVRTLTCPRCHAGPGLPCTYEPIGSHAPMGHIAHTGRYVAAVAARLVPALGRANYSRRGR